MNASHAMPMFPLGTVLLPGGLLPLHVFEPRYRDMVRDCLRGEGEPEFGQVLITHGREVGGGDERATVGTVAHMVHVDALDGERYAFLAVGIRRIVVQQWLPDDPYPVANVVDWPDSDVRGDRFEAQLAAADARVRDVNELAARVAALASGAEAIEGDRGELDFEIATDPVAATYQLSAVAPVGPADRYRLLAAPGPADRLSLLGEILDDVEAMLRFRLS